MKTQAYKKIFYGVLAVGLCVSFSQAKQYSVPEIYTQMCSKCHGINAEGNPDKKGPSLNDMSKSELSYELFDLVGNGSQSSGSTHDKMAHNQKSIANKGMTYHPDDMALYIYVTFNKDQDKYALKTVRDSTRPYSVSEIYTNMCSKCHGMKAEGNPEKKGPSLNDMSKSEIEMELYDIQSDGFQSSGSANEVMSHNQKNIEDKGMTYHPEDMATYIFFNFNPDAKK